MPPDSTRMDSTVTGMAAPPLLGSTTSTTAEAKGSVVPRFRPCTLPRVPPVVGTPPGVKSMPVRVGVA